MANSHGYESIPSPRSKRKKSHKSHNKSSSVYNHYQSTSPKKSKSPKRRSKSRRISEKTNLMNKLSDYTGYNPSYYAKMNISALEELVEIHSGSRKYSKSRRRSRK